MVKEKTAQVYEDKVSSTEKERLIGQRDRRHRSHEFINCEFNTAPTAPQLRHSGHFTKSIGLRWRYCSALSQAPLDIRQSWRENLNRGFHVLSIAIPAMLSDTLLVPRTRKSEPESRRRATTDYIRTSKVVLIASYHDTNSNASCAV